MRVVEWCVRCIVRLNNLSQAPYLPYLLFEENFDGMLRLLHKLMFVQHAFYAKSSSNFVFTGIGMPAKGAIAKLNIIR